ncbi:uncharacterized protein B0I36DRAFT_343713 [Microdochium trichocladiopsis]|uniref:Uncharacterized protein n=1 Tax=Microdochium trichocladiopsis TaxID=1682393 RepID=A0A9P9BZ98_9PEZI|nr:uncharacterized protein B0I36DRAFT_343713 [Microdochium trichocladiopsis]KAH7039884.1 hypothetical protein B0I36DRAFT_343713 [Microdochium trichocladiopsis]
MFDDSPFKCDKYQYIESADLDAGESNASDDDLTEPVLSEMRQADCIQPQEGSTGVSHSLIPDLAFYKQDDSEIRNIKSQSGFSAKILKSSIEAILSANQSYTKWTKKLDDIIPMLDVEFLAVRLGALCDALLDRQATVSQSSQVPNTFDKIIQGVSDINDDTCRSVIRHTLSSVSAHEEFEGSKAALIQEMKAATPGKSGGDENNALKYFAQKLSARAIALGGNKRANTNQKFKKSRLLASTSHRTSSRNSELVYSEYYLSCPLCCIIAVMACLHDQLEQGIRALSSGPGRRLVEASESGTMTRDDCEAVFTDIQTVAQSYGFQLPTPTADGFHFVVFTPELVLQAGLQDLDLKDESVFVLTTTPTNPRLAITPLQPRDRGADLKDQSHWGFWLVQVEGGKRLRKDAKKFVLQCTWFDSAVKDPQAAQVTDDHYGHADASERLRSLIPNLEVEIGGISWSIRELKAPSYGHIRPEDCGIHVIRNATAVMRGENRMDSQIGNTECGQLRRSYRRMLLQYLRYLQVQRENIKDGQSTAGHQPWESKTVLLANGLVIVVEVVQERVVPILGDESLHELLRIWSPDVNLPTTDLTWSQLIE